MGAALHWRFSSMVEAVVSRISVLPALVLWVCSRGFTILEHERIRDDLDADMNVFRYTRALTLFQEQTTTRRRALFIPLTRLDCTDGVLLCIFFVTVIVDEIL
jgi:hypothetical protein